MATYNLSTSQTDRINLDNKAYTDGSEDARIHFPNTLIQAGILKEAATNAAQRWIDETEDLTDDTEEFVARYVDAYVKAYEKQVAQMREERAS